MDVCPMTMTMKGAFWVDGRFGSGRFGSEGLIVPVVPTGLLQSVMNLQPLSTCRTPSWPPRRLGPQPRSRRGDGPEASIQPFRLEGAAKAS